jgi:hypothetical protein
MKTLVLLALLGVSLPALADRLPLPANTPASYKTECASCHLAYPPVLLSAADWQRTLASLKNHFGSDAELSPAQKPEIASFLERNAGDARRLAGAGNPPRISKTAQFVRRHDEVPSRFWRDPRVKSAANCEACHTHAADGRYSERDIAIPELRE